MSNLTRQQLANYALNATLLTVLASAWSAGKWPASATVILLATAVLVLAVSAAALWLTKEKPSAPAQATNFHHFIPQTAASTPSDNWLFVDIPGRAVASGEWFVSNALHKCHSSLLALPIKEASFLHSKLAVAQPADPESYTVKVGIVTIEVCKGHAEIKIDAKPSQARAKVTELVVAPELFPHRPLDFWQTDIANENGAIDQDRRVH
jgi:hypothetical protein